MARCFAVGVEDMTTEMVDRFGDGRRFLLLLAGCDGERLPLPLLDDAVAALPMTDGHARSRATELLACGGTARNHERRIILFLSLSVWRWRRNEASEQKARMSAVDLR